MKHLWLLLLLFVPTVSFSQDPGKPVEKRQIESHEYKSPTINPEYKYMEELERKTHNCDPPEPIKISGSDNYEFDPDAAPSYPAGQSHFNPEPVDNGSKEIVITHLDESGDVCDFVAYTCTDQQGSMKWTDEMLDMFEGRFERDISPEQVKQLYCLKKQNCHVRP